MAHGKVETRRNNVKIITVNPDRCTGCRLCELACSLKNTGEFNSARSRIRVMAYDESYCVPVMCFQCEHPYCAEVCPVGAIIRDEATGMVKVMEDKCRGCKTCILACPFGNMIFSREKKAVENCNFCNGEPECVRVCATQALEFKEVDTARDGAISARLEPIHGEAPLDISKLLLCIEGRKVLNYRS
jgi:carbon-monoxide dehydrogenase iron sulfur subunit